MSISTLFPGTASDTGTGGTGGSGGIWSNPTNIKVEDGSLSSTGTTNSGFTRYLSATNFGFAIPGGVNIVAITADIKLSSSNNADVDQLRAFFELSAAQQGTQRTATISSTTSLAYYTIDLLTGNSFAPTISNINDSTFGLQFQLHNTNAGPTSLSVDAVRINVTYGTTTTKTLSVSSASVAIIDTSVTSGTTSTDCDFGTSASNVNFTGFTWTNPSNALIEDGSSAVCHPSAGATSDLLQVTGFGFAIPSSHVITEITVKVKISCVTSGDAINSAAQLILGGVTVGGDLQNASPTINSTPQWVTIPDPGPPFNKYLTSHNWLYSEVNDPTFGVSFTVDQKSVTGNSDISVDAISICVIHRLPVTNDKELDVTSATSDGVLTASSRHRTLSTAGSASSAVIKFGYFHLITVICASLAYVLKTFPVAMAVLAVSIVSASIKHVLLKILSVSSTTTATILKTIHTLITKVLTVASPIVSNILRSRTALLVAATAANAAGFIRRIIFAPWVALQPSVARFTRAFVLTKFVSAVIQGVANFGIQHGRTFLVTSNVLRMLLKKVNKTLRVLLTGGVTYVRQIGLVRAAVNTVKSIIRNSYTLTLRMVQSVSAINLSKFYGKLLSASQASAKVIVKQWQTVFSIISVTSAVFVRQINKLFSIISQAVDIVRNSNVSKTMLSYGSSSLNILRQPNKLLSVTSTSVKTLVKGITQTFTITSTTVASFVRLISKKFVLLPSYVMSITKQTNKNVVVSSLTTPLLNFGYFLRLTVSSAASRAFNKVIAVSKLCSSATTSTATKLIPKLFSIVSGSLISLVLVKSLTKIMLYTQNTASSLFKAVGHIFSTVSQGSTIGISLTKAFSRALSVVSSTTGYVFKSLHGTLITTTQTISKFGKAIASSALLLTVAPSYVVRITKQGLKNLTTSSVVSTVYVKCVNLVRLVTSSVTSTLPKVFYKLLYVISQVYLGVGKAITQTILAVSTSTLYVLKRLSSAISVASNTVVSTLRKWGALNRWWR